MGSYYLSEAELDRIRHKEYHGADANCGDIPPGFPKHISLPQAWTGDETSEKQSEWRLDLTTEEIASIISALEGFANTHHPAREHLSAISRTTFELPAALSQRLASISAHVYEGLGFQIIHGWNSSDWTTLENVIVYAGLASHAFPERGFIDVQCTHVLGHVLNLHGDYSSPKAVAPAFSNSPLSFHTDHCEIMGLFYAETAPVGGFTIIASSLQTYNDLVKKRPDVLQTLAEPWVFDTFKPYEIYPPRHERLLQLVDSERVLLRFSRYGMTGWQSKRNPDLPSPTQAQMEALDAVQSIAMANAFTVPTVRGDFLFVNDMAMIHARNAFEEGEGRMKRHLIKMFFRDPARSWPLPDPVESLMKKIYGPNQDDGSRKEVWQLTCHPVVRGPGTDDKNNDDKKGPHSLMNG